MRTISNLFSRKLILRVFIIICFVVLIFSIESHAKVMTATTTGTAASRDAAIEDALIQAVHQIKGFSLESATVAVRSGKTETTNGKRDTKYRAENASVTGMKSSGVIAGYDIIDEDNTNGVYKVTLEAQVNVYETPGLSPHTRRKLGIVAFEASSTNRKRGVPKVLRQKLTDRLVQSRRFTVLDRENERLYQQEKANWKSEDFAVEEQAKLGMRLGADYIVTGKILSYVTTSTKHDIKATGESYYVERIARKFRTRYLCLQPCSLNGHPPLP